MFLTSLVAVRLGDAAVDADEDRVGEVLRGRGDGDAGVLGFGADEALMVRLAAQAVQPVDQEHVELAAPHRLAAASHLGALEEFGAGLPIFEDGDDVPALPLGIGEAFVALRVHPELVGGAGVETRR